LLHFFRPTARGIIFPNIYVYHNSNISIDLQLVNQNTPSVPT
jgi:hypothetical protein